MTVSALTTYVLYVCKVPTLASAIAGIIISGATAQTSSQCIYYIEDCYGYNGMTGFYREYDDYWYYDSNYTNYVTGDTYYGFLS